MLTEKKMFNISPQNTLLFMLIVPFILAITYWFLLTPSPSVYRVNILNPKTWIVPAKAILTVQVDNKTTIEGFSTIASPDNDEKTDKPESFASSLNTSTSSTKSISRLRYIAVKFFF